MGEPEQILVVEDDPDIAWLLADLLRHEGYAVVTARDGSEGLGLLRARRFAVVLTDYRMPGMTGLTMLTEARDAGLLVDTKALIVSAEIGVQAPAEWKVLRKPVDCDLLFEEVHAAVLAHHPDAVRPAVRRGASTPSATTGPILELVLYVTAASASSGRARRNLERVLARYEAAQVALRVVDLSQPGSEADGEDRVVFTPTLVRRSPGPRAWLLGDLRDLTMVRAMLEDAGVARRTT